MRLIALAALGAGVYLATRADNAGPPNEAGSNDPAKAGGRLPRGIRNNNPGNIERTGTRWQGMAADQSADPRFIVFEDAVWGIRALARVLKNYRELHGLTTPREIINRWAPPFENDTGSYARAVGQAVGVLEDDPIPDSEASRLALVKAIIHHENGLQPYPDMLIQDGIRRAYA